MLEEYTDTFNDIYEAVPKGKLYRIYFDNVVKHFKIVCRDNSYLDEIREAFSSKNDAQFFSRQYGYQTSDKIYEITRFGHFLPGFIFNVLRWIKENYGTLDCIAMSDNCKKYISDYLTPLKKSIVKEFKLSNISDDLGRNNELERQNQHGREIRDYQEKAIQSLIFNGYGRGLIEVPTGAGKSFIIANFIWNIYKNIDKSMKFLILVPNTQLVQQFYHDLIDYGFDKRDIARLSGSLSKAEKKENDVDNAKIIVSNRQYIFSNKDKLPKIDALIADECHSCVAKSTAEFIESIDAKIKIGCSGTLPIKDHDKWQLIGLFGKVLFKEKVTTLQHKGYISNLKITLLKIKSMSIENDKTLPFNLDTDIKFDLEAAEAGRSDIMFNDAYIAEKQFFNDNYQALYDPVFKYLVDQHSNTLMLFDRIDIGTNLFQFAKKFYTNKNVFYIDGSIDVHEREKITQQFEQSDENLLIAQNAIMSTGVNIKRLTNLVFLTSSKSFTRTIQSIGRTLRLHELKQAAHLIDISWNTKYSQKHLRERLKIYKDIYSKTPDEVIRVKI